MAKETKNSIKQIWKQELLDRLGIIIPRGGFYYVNDDVTFLKRKKDVDCISIVWGKRYFYYFNKFEQKVMRSVMDVLKENFKPMNFAQHQETLNGPVFQWVFVYDSTKKDLKRLEMWLDAYLDVCNELQNWRLSGYSLSDPLNLIKNLKERNISIDDKIYEEMRQKLLLMIEETKKMIGIQLSVEKFRESARCHWVREAIDILKEKELIS